ncbi:MAG: hypothetical protein LBL80_05095 [Ruminococcus sp.]|jgi:hypothetical protein|nr:hypothetical protein [Ruminococcus sp.]
MKKDDLIKRAAARGITIDESQAEKYLTLSDEELENLAIAGGTPCSEKIGFRKSVPYPKRAQVCKDYRLGNNTYFGPPNCIACTHAETAPVTTQNGLETAIYCTNYDAWDGMV